MPFADVRNGGRIYFDDSGSGAPVFLVAGIGGVGAYWAPQVEVFSRKYRLVVHDHRGTGRSSRDVIQYSVRQMMDDMLDLMDHLQIERAHIVGHSTGAAMAQELALSHPDRIASAVLYAGWAKPDAYFKRVFSVRSELLLTSGPLAYVRTTPIFLCPPWWINANIEALEAEEPALADQLPTAEIMLSRIKAICDYAPGNTLQEVRCPSLVLCARDDNLTPPDRSDEVAALIPGAQTYYFERGGHAVSQTRPFEFNAIVTAFLDAVIAGR